MYFAGDLVCPVMEHVAIGTMRTYARPVGVVRGGLELLEHVRSHFAARGATDLGVRQLQGGVEGAPEYDPRNKSGQHQKSECENRA